MLRIFFERSEKIPEKLLYFYGNFSLRSKNITKGFTLVELLLVVATMLIVSSMTPIFYSRFLLQNSVANTADQLVGSLRKAQLYSMMGKQNSQWSVNFSSNTITLYMGKIFTGHDPTFDETFSVHSNVSISPNPVDVTFFRMTGTPSASPSITISSGTNSKIVTVNGQGVVSK